MGALTVKSLTRQIQVARAQGCQATALESPGEATRHYQTYEAETILRQMVARVVMLQPVAKHLPGGMIR